MSLLLTLNMFYNLHYVKNACFVLEKRTESKFNRLQIEVSFLPNISTVNILI